MTLDADKPFGRADKCIGLPLEQALSVCRGRGWDLDIVYTGERAAGEGLTPRVIALQRNTLVVAYFRDSDPSEEKQWKT